MRTSFRRSISIACRTSNYDWSGKLLSRKTYRVIAIVSFVSAMVVTVAFILYGNRVYLLARINKPRAIIHRLSGYTGMRKFAVQKSYKRTRIVGILGLLDVRSFNNLRLVNRPAGTDPDQVHHYPSSKCFPFAATTVVDMNSCHPSNTASSEKAAQI